MDCNADLLAEARANVAARNNPAHRRAICERGEWDGGSLVRAEVERLLKNPPSVEQADD